MAAALTALVIFLVVITVVPYMVLGYPIWEIFSGGGGGGGPSSSGYDGTYAATVTTVTPIGTTTLSGTFTVANGRVSDPGGTFTGTVDANGNFTGTTIVSPGSPKMAVTGRFSLSGNFTLRGSSGNTSQTIVAHKI